MRKHCISPVSNAVKLWYVVWTAAGREAANTRGGEDELETPDGQTLHHKQTILEMRASASRPDQPGLISSNPHRHNTGYTKLSVDVIVLIQVFQSWIRTVRRNPMENKKHTMFGHIQGVGSERPRGRK